MEEKDDSKMSAADMMKAFKNTDGGDGKNIIAMSIETFSMADGKSKKDDFCVKTLDDALVGLKQFVELSKEKAIKKKKKKKNDENPAKKWDFETVPLKEFDKTLDDVYTCFLTWGRQNVGGEKSDNTEDKEKEYNISKSFRRLESYADWMHSSREDLQDMKASEMKNIHEIWQLKASVDKSGRFIWWFDMGASDIKASKAITPEENLRYFVWYSHCMMFDKNAQEHGVAIVESLAKIGFWAAMTIFPPKLGAKLDRLTIGVLPVKMKKFYILDCPGWMHVMMALMSPFMSKKMKSRLLILDKDYDKMYKDLGGNEYVFNGFGKKLDGTLTEDFVTTQYFA